MKKRFDFATALLTLIFAFAFSAFAQNQNPVAPSPTPTPKAQKAIDDGDVIKVESRLVIVPVSVTDDAGQPVLGLKKQDFLLQEENKTQQIEQIGDAEKVPLEIALLIDVSSSLNPLFKFQQETAARFLQEVMRPEDRATIFLIGEKPRLAQVRDTSEKTVAAILNMPLPGKSATAFYDSVSAATNYLKQNAPQRSRRVILALTDGEDNFSNSVRAAEIKNYRDVDFNKLDEKELNKLAARTDQTHRQAQAQVLKQLQDADTIFYAVNPAGTSIRFNKISMRAQTAMQSFSVETGGTAFLPKFSTTNLKDQLQNAQNMRLNQEALVKIFRQLANELRAQYLVQYYSESDFPQNKYVKLNVGLTNPNKFRVRARQGYFVKN